MKVPKPAGIRRFVAAVTLVGLAAGASTVYAATSSPSSSRASIDRKTFCQGGYTQVAYAGPMSGSGATYGQAQLQGLQMAVAKLNSAGGFAAGPLKGCKVKVLGPYDDRGDPSTGASIATKVATNSNLLAYFGNVNSGVTIVALPILARAGIPMINSYSSNPKITSMGYKNVFRVILTDVTQGNSMAQLFVKRFHKKRLVGLWPNDVFGQGIGAAFAAEVKRLGAQLVLDYSYPDTSTDFSVFVSKVKDAKADGIGFLGLYAGDGAAIKQLAAAGITPANTTFLTNVSDNTPELVSIAGPSAAEGTYLIAIWNRAGANKAGQAFAKAFHAKYNADPPEDAATSYDAFMVFARAVEHGGGDRASLIKALHQINAKHPYIGVTGSIGFDASGQRAVQIPALLRVVNGQIVPVK